MSGLQSYLLPVRADWSILESWHRGAPFKIPSNVGRLFFSHPSLVPQRAHSQANLTGVQLLVSLVKRCHNCRWSSHNSNFNNSTHCLRNKDMITWQAYTSQFHEFIRKHRCFYASNIHEKISPF